MLKKLLIGWLSVLGVLVVVTLKLPSVVDVERHALIERPPAIVFTLLNGFSRFEDWSLLHRRDPETLFRIRGPEQGVGAGVAWQGDPRRVGNGFLEIRDSVPFSRVEMKLEIEGQGEALSQFDIAREGNGTRLTWRLTVDTRQAGGWFPSLVARYFAILLDPWLGPEMEESLAALKTVAETRPTPGPAPGGVEIVEVSSVPVIFVSGRTSQASADISAALTEGFAEIFAFFEQNAITASGPPVAITRSWDENGYGFEAAVPYNGPPPVLEGRLQAGSTPAGWAARIIHRGPYEDILQTYQKLAEYLSAHGLEQGGVSWEQYDGEASGQSGEHAVIRIFVQLAALDPGARTTGPAGPARPDPHEDPG